MKIVYFIYLLKITNFKWLFDSISYSAKQKKVSRFNILTDMLITFYRFNIDFVDYFQQDYYEKKAHEIATYADMFFMYQFQKKLNHKKDRKFFKNKTLFYDKFKNFICHENFLISEGNIKLFKIWLTTHKPTAIITKAHHGQAGGGIEKRNVHYKKGEWFFDNLNLEAFFSKCLNQDQKLIENYIQQHDLLKALHPSSLNTIRISTVINNNGQIDLIGAALRMGTDSSFLDNFSKDGVAALIEIKSGKVLGPVCFKNLEKHPPASATLHPTTSIPVVGLEIPFWKEVCEMVKKSAMVVSTVRTVGWDIVITENGPFLLEGNDNWRKTVLEKTLGKGLKPKLKLYL